MSSAQLKIQLYSRILSGADILGKVLHLDQLLTGILSKNLDAQQDLILLLCFIRGKILEISHRIRD